METYVAATELPHSNARQSPLSDDAHFQNPIKLEPPDSIVPLTNILNELVQLKYFLLTGPAQLRTQDGIHRHTLPNKDQISCVVWKNVYFITGTDIVRCLSFRFEAFGREISNRKKFEEGIFSDLRNLKCDSDAVLEQPKSEFLDYLYRNNCVRTQKKQKIFYWFSVNHDRLFQDALERDLKKELGGKKSSTTPVRDPALSFQYDGSRTLHDQLPDIIEKFPRPLADLADASSVMSNLPIMPNNMMPMPPQFVPNMSYQMVPPGEIPIIVNQPPILQSNGMPIYQSNQMLPEGIMIQNQQPAPGQYIMAYPQQPIVPPPVSLSVPPPISDFMIEEQTAIQEPVEEVQSDFPLDYVDPVSNNATLPAQVVFVDQTGEPVDVQQGFYYDDQQLDTQQSFVPSAYDVESYKNTMPEPVITYDNQQFQVVYQQDETGAYTSSMVPTSSAQNYDIAKSLPTTPVRDQSKKSASPVRSVQQPQQRVPTRNASPLRYSSPKKPIAKDEMVQLQSTAGSMTSRIPSALQAKKLNSKISKSSLKPRPRTHDKHDYHSAAYFMPTPSESGCSDIATFSQDHDFSDANSPGMPFRRPISRPDSARLVEFHHDASSGYTLKTAHPVSRRASEGLRVISQHRIQPQQHLQQQQQHHHQQIQQQQQQNQLDDIYPEQSPARSDFDNVTNDANQNEDLYVDLAADDGYIYGDRYVQEEVGDWM